MEKFAFKKILVVGCGGAGKSTLSVALGEKLHIPVVHLDRLWWLENWIERTQEEFDSLLDIELEKDCWIIDGNYKRTFEKRLNAADFCIFLDYPERLCIDSVYERAEKYRGRTRPDMTEGCPERVDEEFEQWIILFREKVRPYMLDAIESSGKAHKIFSSREQAQAWFNDIES